ncbi:MAG: 1-deoxy-D-xylulose-5-phosphate reductoisomerase [Burkholderiales bacterium]|jgi:1-deoxy-D-xylulose-5-phosphate reductoisomerase|nr:1-deoxy-D-xylulose-5-phosphate reductoisomerase [Burkholderiales bacterium]
MSRKRVTLLGATGSIGASTLDVIARHPERFEVTALAAHKNGEALRELCRRYRPRYAALLNETAAQVLRQGLREDGLQTDVLSGAEGVQTVAALPEVDTVLAAITGAAGLLPTLAAVRAGKRVLLANKESLVMGGALFMEAVRSGGATLLPIDSEHNAIFQCLPGTAQHCGTRPPGVRKIILTASGGPFREMPLEALREVTPEQACAHPVWKMGRKISVDSATMMNKGLEVIEAHWLFGMPVAAIEVVIHPQSIVHSFVEYLDGSTLAQLGSPDMRTPIAQALAFPERIDAGVTALDFTALQTKALTLTFAAPERGRFPCLALAYQALSAGGNAALTLNAANEIAVEAFLNRRIGFLDIASVCDAVLSEAQTTTTPATVEDAIAFDAAARRLAERHVAAHALRKGA